LLDAKANPELKEKVINLWTAGTLLGIGRFLPWSWPWTERDDGS